jgi:hypothetical protein
VLNAVKEAQGLRKTEVLRDIDERNAKTAEANADYAIGFLVHKYDLSIEQEGRLRQLVRGARLLVEAGNDAALKLDMDAIRELLGDPDFDFEAEIEHDGNSTNLRAGELLFSVPQLNQPSTLDARVRIKWDPKRTDESMAELRQKILVRYDHIDPLVSGVGSLLHWVKAKPPTSQKDIEAAQRFGTGFGCQRVLARVEEGRLRERIDKSVTFYKEQPVLAPAVEGEDADPQQREMLPDRGRPSEEVLWAMFYDQERRIKAGGALRPGEREVLITEKDMVCPKEVVSWLAGEAQPEAPPCLGIQRSGMINRRGELFSAVGYHKESGVYFDMKVVPPIPAKVTEQTARDSLKWLQDKLFEDFPFATEADRSVAVLALLTVIQRRMIDIAPGFIFSAPLQSNGKTTLVDLIAAIAIGWPVAGNIWNKNEEEFQKLLMPLLQSGSQVVLFDNLPEGSQITSNCLAMAMTKPEYEGRVLGFSKTLIVSSLTTFFATGNNVVMKGDLRSRFLPCYIDAKSENPEGRQFARPNIMQWAADNRDIALLHCLTVLAFGVRRMNAGKPLPHAIKNRRFAQWNDLVYGPALMAGLAPVDEAVEREAAQDEERESHSAFVEAWHAAFGQAKLTLSDAIAACRIAEPGEIDPTRPFGTDVSKMPPEQAARCELLRQMYEMMSMRPPSARPLALRVRRFKNQRFGNLTWQSHPTVGKHAETWGVHAATADEVVDSE